MKIIAILLSVILCLGIFAGCTNDNDSDDSVETESETETEKISFEHSTVVSLGKSYTTSVAAADEYADSYGSELTDGIFAEGDTVSYSNQTLCGFSLEGSAFDIVVDLEKDGKRLHEFQISYLSTRNAGIAPISSCTVYVSDDQKNWTKLGLVKKPEYVAETVQTAVLKLDEHVNGRYVRFFVIKGSAWTFLNEVTVIADIAGTEKDLEYIKLLDEVYSNDELTNEQKLSYLNKVSGVQIDRSLEKILISKGCSYSLSYTPDTNQFANDGKKITDGSRPGTAFESKAWVGFKNGKQLDLTINLHEERTDLADFELSMYSRPATGYVLPVYVDVSVSSDNKDFTFIGRVYANTDLSQRNYTYSLRLPKGVKGKYVRFTLAETESDMFLVEEAAVYIYNDEFYDNMDAVYPKVSLPKVDKATYWPSGASNRIQNLIRNMPYQISSGTELEPGIEKQYNDPVTDPKLTDGKTSATNAYTNSEWFRFHRGSSRNIYFDLTHNTAITGYSINFLNHKSVAVLIPGMVSLYLSDDGEYWYPVDFTKVEEEGEVGISKVKVELDQATEARFARFSFGVGVHTYVDEIELFGTKYVGPSVKKLSDLGIKAERTGSMLAPDQNILSGVKDVLLAYHNSQTAKLTKDVFLSYAGYTDKEGNIKDTMFDGFLFLPATGTLPSGGHAYKDSIKTDWDYVLDNAFTKDLNIDALNKAVSEVKKAINNPDYKVKIFYTILYPSSGITNFGDVDGDGESEDFSKLDDRLKAIEWYMDEFLNRFEQGNYENLEFAGFYWFHEAINKEEDDLNTLQGVSKLVHDKNSQFFWIPYFSANGFHQWPIYGFDAVCMQPNYAFNADTPISRLKEAAEIIKQYNMCIEMEINSPALHEDEFFQRYMDYLKGGIYYGYMKDSIHMYYQGVLDFYNASQSDSLKARLIYDYTYQFIKGTLDIYPEKLKDLSFETEKETILSGKLFETDDLTQAMISLTAQNGTVTINANGTFRYYPNKGFSGTDTFTFKISKGLDWSDDTTVEVVVK